MLKRSTTWQKATALVPLALLSGAWTVSLAVSNATASGDEETKLPDGSSLPAEAIKAPASVSSPGEIAPGVPPGSEAQVVSSATTNGIPAAALAAYQRAAQVIGTADAACNLDWTLLAAIGRVESDHGRYGGNVLSADGVATPGIYGIPLDGTNGTQKISDTDAGGFDQDTVHDRAVGPMQFIPSTWSVVGVDGDGDGKRNPQDIDDAALAAAVYLCSGSEDLSTDEGVSSAVYRYNHSDAYVELVKQIAAAYAAGDYTSVPTSSYAPVYFGPSYDDSIFNLGTTGYHSPKPGKGPRPTKNPGTQEGPGTDETPEPNETPDPADKVKDPVKTITDGLTKVPEAIEGAVDDLAAATEYCAENLTQAQIDLLGGLQACAEAYMDGGVNAINNLLDSLGLGGLLGGLLPKP
ncbi:MAG TPA: lytic murein transglycosylase [Nocardioidaceae bacterium]|nr:lytic murein transglycosylase [Nocardioidaceae bacterium]